MSIGAIIAIILAVSFVVGPILMLQPSKRQKRIVRWRQSAIEAGFQVNMESFEGKFLAGYHYPWQVKKNRRAWGLHRENYEHGLHFAGYWQWRNDGRPVDAVLNHLAKVIEQLPKDVYMLEGNSRSVGCYWAEGGSEQDYQQILAWLKSLVEADADAPIEYIVDEPAQD